MFKPIIDIPASVRSSKIDCVKGGSRSVLGADLDAVSSLILIQVSKASIGVAEKREKIGVEDCTDSTFTLGPEQSADQGASAVAHAKRLVRFARGKCRADGMATWLAGRLDEGSASILGNGWSVADVRLKAEKLCQCGSWLRFRDYYTVGEVKLHAANFCCLAYLCPFCASLRASRGARRYLTRFQALMAAKGVYGASMLTLTMRSRANLHEMLDLLERAISNRFGRAAQSVKRGISSSEFGKFSSAVVSIEIKRGRGGLWHAHAHALVIQTGWVDLPALTAEWARAVGQEKASVSLRALEGVKLCDPSRLMKDFAEVFKYAVKLGADLSFSDNWAAYLAACGRRMVRSYGGFRGVKVPDDLTDEDVYLNLPYFALYYDFNFGSKAFDLTSRVHVVPA